MRLPNTLTTRQNSPEAIKQLRAQRYLHDRAKRVVGLQVVLTTFFPIAGTILEMFWRIPSQIAALTNDSSQRKWNFAAAAGYQLASVSSSWPFR